MSDAWIGPNHLIERFSYPPSPNRDHFALVYLVCILIIPGSSLSSYIVEFLSLALVLPLSSAYSVLALDLIIECISVWTLEPDGLNSNPDFILTRCKILGISFSLSVFQSPPVKWI